MKAQVLVLATQPFKLLLESALLEHFIGLLFVECAAHATISRVHRKDTGAI